jgi:beta-glucanase (GH16 family)
MAGWGAAGARRRPLLLGAAAAISLVASGCALVPNAPLATHPPSASSGTLAPPPGYSSSQLLVDDQFAGSSLNGANWNTFMTSKAANGSPWDGNGSGGSGEGCQNDAAYWLPAQLSVSSGLTITANERSVGNAVCNSAPWTAPWASAALTSYNHFQFDGGFVQVSAKTSNVSGSWPAIWMLPGPGAATTTDNYEIDLFEGGYTGNGANPASNFAWHLHTPGGTGGGVVNTGVDLSSGFHVYGLGWVPGQSITWYLDGTQIAQITSAQYSIPDEPMELVLSMAVASANTVGWHSQYGTGTPTTAQEQVREVQVY